MTTQQTEQRAVDITDNRLLAQVGSEELEQLRPHMELMQMKQYDIWIQPNEPIKWIHFPITCLGSLVAVLEDGTTVEAGTIGREGMAGVPIVLDAATTPMQTFVQVPGEGYRIRSETLKAVFDQGKTLQKILNRYVHTLFVVASQQAACNRKHQVEARLARWLLASADGIGSNSITITQEFLATMLGVRRPGVTEAAVKLQEQNLIRYTRGFVEITDRRGLEAAACECYSIMRREYERLLA
jgi:CRP-like cAMP-binding protein